MSLSKVSRIQAFEEKVENEIQEIVEETVDLVYKEVKSNAPVDTGNLKSKIKKEVNDMAGKVISGAKYSSAPEFGTYQQEAQRYFRKAIQKGEAYMRKEMKSRLHANSIQT